MNSDTQTQLRMETQRDEFAAMDELTHAYQRLCAIPVVDDAYPVARRDYEIALDELLRACKKNGRTI
jgi:hypothetical protein